MSKQEDKIERRDFLFTATYTVGAVGLGATIWPFIHQMNPDESVKALATTEVDISQVEPGKSITVLWRGKPIFIKRRTPEEIQEAQSVNLKDLPDFSTFVAGTASNSIEKYCAPKRMSSVPRYLVIIVLCILLISITILALVMYYRL